MSLGTVMYRMILCKITLLTAAGLLSACGQSGALMLPSDPNYDKRSQYLLYPNVEPKSAQPSKTSSDTSAPAQN